MTEMECSDKKKKKSHSEHVAQREWNERKSGKKSRQEIRKENEKQGVRLAHRTWKIRIRIGLI